MEIQGGEDEDGEGGGSDIGALLGNLGPLIGGLSGVSCSAACSLITTIITRLRLKCAGTRAETRIRLSAKRTSSFKSAGASFQSTTSS